MSKFFIADELFRVTFPDGEWVDIKTELSQRDQDCIIRNMAKAKTGDKPEIEFDLGRQSLLEIMVKDWSFKENDKPVPVTPDNISNLRQKYRSKVLAEIDRLSKESTSFLPG